MIISRRAGIALIVFSTFISLVFSMMADMEGASLGALINLFWPPFVGIITILIYLLFWLIIKENKGRIILTIILCLYNIYVGVALFLGKDYWPLVMY